MLGNSPAAYNTYNAALRELRHGVALWIPEPFNPPRASSAAYDRVRIGDVGWIEEGSWNRLFNATLPVGDPANRLGVPEGYEPIVNDTIYDDVWENPNIFSLQPLHSKTVSKYEIAIDVNGNAVPAGGGFRFAWSKHRGAVCLLRARTIRENTRIKDVFGEYMLKHYSSWYAFANGSLGRNLRSGDLILVTGTDRTASWAIAAMQGRSKESSISFSASSALMPLGGELKLAGSWENTTSAETRSYDSQDLEFDQTIFLRGFKVKERLIAPKVIQAAATGRSNSESSGSDNSDSEGGASCAIATSDSSSEFDVKLEALDETDPFYHPADALLNHVLSTTDASVAMVHDDDWCGSSPSGQLAQATPEIIESLISSFAEHFFQEPSDDANLSQSHKRRKRGARKGKNPATHPAPSLVDEDQTDSAAERLLRASHALARELARVSPDPQSQSFESVEPLSFGGAWRPSSSERPSSSSQRAKDKQDPASSSAFTRYQSLSNVASRLIGQGGHSSGIDWDDSASTAGSEWTTATTSSSSSQPSYTTGATSVDSESNGAQPPIRVPLGLSERLPTNIKFMTGVPWELDELPRGWQSPVSANPRRKLTKPTRKPEAGELDTITERPGESPPQLHADASTSTTPLAEEDAGGSTGSNKAAKGQVTALARMLSALRR